MRRAARPAGSRSRRSGTPDGSADPLVPLRALEARRGTEAAERALEHWERTVVDSREAFDATTSALSTGTGLAFTAEERWFLLAILAEMHRDAELDGMAEALDERLAETARAWPGNAADQLDDETLREESPVYLALADAQQALLLAQQVAWLESVGRGDMARALMHEPEQWDRTLQAGETALLGGARIVMTAADDPFGILLP
jgi:hypothetical protein